MPRGGCSASDAEPRAGPRSALFSDDKIRSIQPLLGLMREIGEGHGGKTAAQVAINWVISKGEREGITAIPILGGHHARILQSMSFGFTMNS